MRQLEGVYGLDLLEFLAGALSVSYPHSMGWGFQAQGIRTALRAHFEQIAEFPETLPPLTAAMLVDHSGQLPMIHIWITL